MARSQVTQLVLTFPSKSDARRVFKNYPKVTSGDLNKAERVHIGSEVLSQSFLEDKISRIESMVAEFPCECMPQDMLDRPDYFYCLYCEITNEIKRTS